MLITDEIYRDCFLNSLQFGRAFSYDEIDKGEIRPRECSNHSAKRPYINLYVGTYLDMDCIYLLSHWDIHLKWDWKALKNLHRYNIEMPHVEDTNST